MHTPHNTPHNIRHTSQGLGYFLIDFCYVVNFCTFLLIYAFPTDQEFFKVS